MRVPNELRILWNICSSNQNHVRSKNRLGPLEHWNLCNIGFILIDAEESSDITVASEARIPTMQERILVEI